MSQFFQGLLSSYEVNNSFTISALAESFKIAAKNTRKSLPNQVDGTMMNVYEEIADAAHNGLDESEKLEDLLKIIAYSSIISVKNTQSHNRLLKQKSSQISG